MDTRRASRNFKVLHNATDLSECMDAGNVELLQPNQPDNLSCSNYALRYISSFTSTIDTPSAQYETSVVSREATVADDFLFPKQHRGATSPQLIQQRFLSGWRIGALVSRIGGSLVFILNLGLTIWVWRNPEYEINGTIGTLLQGSCSKVRKLNVWFHLLVNVLSTLLLCGSNYCMQVPNAPNRAEIDHAHAHQQWLHIGVPSLHNLLQIAPERSLLWFLLVISTLPLHLLFNSVVFTNLQANNYNVVPTMEEWLYGSPYNFSGFLGFQDNITSLITSRPNLTDTITLGDGSVAPRYKNISTVECFNKYNTQYTSDVGDVYIIQSKPTVWRNQTLWKLCADRNGNFTWFIGATSNIHSTQEIGRPLWYLSKPNTFPANGWRCPSRRNATCNVADEHEVPRDKSLWAPYESPVRYCIVEKVPEICKLQFSLLIATIVVASNLVQAIVIAWLLFRFKSHDALVTLGDAVASFLEHPDPATRGRCLQSRVQIQKDLNALVMMKATTSLYGIVATSPKRFKPEKPRWSQAPSYGRWFGTYLCYVMGVVFGIVCIAWSLDSMPSSVSELWKIGFGTVAGNNLLNKSTSLIGGVLLASSPQVALSYLNLAFNALYTNMFIAQEWSSYLHNRKTLRVTCPTGQQRASYWLSVPFRYAIPMTVVSGLFHWLASQSLFMVQITVTQVLTREIVPTQQISTCGYSPFAIILTTVTATFIALGGIVVGKFEYPAGMPMAGSCSMAISAACHPPLGDVDAHLKPVQWGVVSHEEQTDHEEEIVRHCSFSSLPVEMPLAGHLYA